MGEGERETPVHETVTASPLVPEVVLTDIDGTAAVRGAAISMEKSTMACGRLSVWDTTLLCHLPHYGSRFTGKFRGPALVGDRWTQSTAARST